jgi:site-specific recombinase
MARRASAWDLTALLNAADARAPLPQRHVWLVRLMEWLRHAPAHKDSPPVAVPSLLPEGVGPAGAPSSPVGSAEPRTPRPLLKLRHLLGVLERNPAYREQVQGMAQAFWRQIDAAALFADFGFSARLALRSELTSRIRQRLLPRTPETTDLAELFPLIFSPADLGWIEHIDAPTFERVAALLAPQPGVLDWRRKMLDAITILVSAVHAAGYSPPLRKRMSAGHLEGEPFRQLTRAADNLRRALGEGDQAGALHEAQYLRGLLDACRRASDSITDHLEEFGVSVDIVFEMDQLRSRCARIEQLLECVLSPAPAPDLLRLLTELVRVEGHLLGLRKLMARHYSLLARLVAERHADTGEHYITRNRAEYRDMLRRAAGGGAVIAGTTFFKFGIVALGLSAFWSGFWTGVNYAASFVVIMLLHWTVATKQPAMTAPALATSLGTVTGARPGPERKAAMQGFVDRIAALIRSQAAGIFGNLALCAPLVLAIQLAAEAVFGVPLVGSAQAEHVLHDLTLLGPTALFAAFTGVLLFASSLIAGWAENWFVFHRLDSAIAWNPRITARLGAARAQRWARWWRANISGLAANVSLGLMLGIVPALFGFFGLPLEVRHVTLSTGQLAAAAGALGLEVLREPAFWWCVAGIAVTGLLNLTVSFWLALKVALRSRGIRVGERRQVMAAIRRRLRTEPLSFLRPPAAPATTDDVPLRGS